MPKRETKKQPVQPVAPTPPPAPAPELVPPALAKPNRLVVYDRLEMDEYSTASAKGPLDAAWCKEAMGWETEKEYQTRMVKEKGGKPEHYLFGDLGIRHEDGSVSPVHCKDVAGQKVVCKFNAGNRSFDEDWCGALVETVLYGQWAGPFTIPLGNDGLPATVNGETVRISRYGMVVSGQHEMSACILADEYLHLARQQKIDLPDKPKYPVWAKHSGVFIEVIVVKGLTEDPRVLMTVDYVKPRTVADMLYTSEVFKDCTSAERKELCKMMAVAADTLWTRTKAQGYRTHPEVAGFLDRHKTLMKCVTHLFAENGAAGGRKISKLRLSPGQCAALMYVMASSGPKTEGDFYRNEEPPTEKNLDWSYWDKAEEFWTLLASGQDFVTVRTAMGRLVDSTPSNEDNQGLGGRGPEKLAILAAAWERWKDWTGSGHVFDLDDLALGGDLCLSYSDVDDKGNKLPDGQVKLVNVADFFGIDCPEVIGNKKSAPKGPPEPPPPSPEEMEKMYEAARARRGHPAGK